MLRPEDFLTSDDCRYALADEVICKVTKENVRLVDHVKIRRNEKEREREREREVEQRM